MVTVMLHHAIKLHIEIINEDTNKTP